MAGQKIKSLKFSINYLSIDNKTFAISDFDSIKDGKRKAPKDLSAQEVINKIVISKKHIQEDRFVTIYFNEGSEFPYSETVINSTDPSLEEENNPRPPEKIEMDKQSFVLLDVKEQKIYITLIQRKAVSQRLERELNKLIYIKPIISEEEFVKNMKSIKKISFSVTKNLFNKAEEALSHVLTKDVDGFEAEKATLELKYKKNSMSQIIKEKIQSLLKHKNEFEDLVITGRNEENFESVFNLKGIVTKIGIKVNLDAKTNELDYEEVFQKLTEQIKEHEKNRNS